MKAEPPKHYRRPLGQPVTEYLLMACLAAAGLVALTAQRHFTAGDNPLTQLHAFYRLPLALVLPPHRVLPWSVLLLAIAVVLGAMALLPRVRPDVRGLTAAYAFLLLLGPVLNYGPQVEALTMQPADLQTMRAELPPAQQAAVRADRFNPVLPVTWPILAAALVLLGWAVVTRPAEWPDGAKAVFFVGVVLVVGGLALSRLLLAARGNALQYNYTEWPGDVSSLWTVGQLAAACLAAAALGRDPLRSRIFAGVTALLLVGTAVALGAKP